MTDRYSSSDELRLPFIYVPYGQPESPDVAAFKARYPGWFSIPATFTPYPEPEERAGTDPEPGTFVGPPEPSGRPVPAPPARSMGRVDTPAALRAFQRASALHGDPVAALRALRDTPDDFVDDPRQVQIAQAFATPGYIPPPPSVIGSDLDNAARELSNAVTRTFQKALRQESGPNQQVDADPIILNNQQQNDAPPAKGENVSSVEPRLKTSSAGQRPADPQEGQRRNMIDRAASSMHKVISTH